MGAGTAGFEQSLNLRLRQEALIVVTQQQGFQRAVLRAVKRNMSPVSCQHQHSVQHVDVLVHGAAFEAGKHLFTHPDIKNGICQLHQWLGSQCLAQVGVEHAIVMMWLCFRSLCVRKVVFIEEHIQREMPFGSTILLTRYLAEAEEGHAETRVLLTHCF